MQLGLAATKTTEQPRRARILVANIAATDEDGIGGRYLRETLVPVTQRNASLAVGSTSDLTFRFASEGVGHPAFADFKYLPKLNAAALIEMVAWSEAHGYDAAVLGCFGDPFLDVIRKRARKPVVGFGESSIRYAATLGRFGMVANSPLLIPSLRHQVDRLGLSHLLVDIIASREPAALQEEGLIDATHAIECFREDGRSLAAVGARSIIPACGILSPALRVAPGCRSPRPLTEIDGVAVIDVVGCAVRAAEKAVHHGDTDVRPSTLQMSHVDVHDHHDAVPPGRFWNCS